MNALQITQDYIRNEKDFLTPLSLSQRLRNILKPQVVAEAQVYPITWMPGIDISGIGQTKEIALAFPELYEAGWKFVIMRASIGLTVDALFDYFWHAAHDAGLYMMAYHLGLTAYNGQAQTSLFLKTIDPMLTEIDGHSAGVLDVEVGTDVVAWRRLIGDFYGGIKNILTAGEYSSVAKWKSCTNNLTPVPGFAWNASWSSLIDVPSFAPAIQTILRQIGVYLKHAWVPQPPGVKEDVDVNYFMGSEPQLRKFLGYDDTPPPPPPSDLEQKVAALELRVTNLENAFNVLSIDNTAEHKKINEDIANQTARIDAILEGGIPTNKPAFQIGSSTANCRVIDKINDAGKPVMVIPPVGPHRIQFKPGEIVLLASTEKVDADGSVDYYQVDPSQYPPGEPAQYLRTIDGVLL